MTGGCRWPEIIPPDTSIPQWAYLDVVTPDIFNVTAAETIAAKGAPDSSAAPSATDSATDSFSSSFVPTPTSTPAPSGPVSLGIGSTNTPADTNNRNASAGSSKKSNVGAIVGGVLGGIGGVAILATVVFALFRRRKYARVANAGPLHVDDDISWGNDIDYPPSDNAHFYQHAPSPSDDVARPSDHPGGVPEFLRQTAHIVEQTQSPSFDIGYLSYYGPRIAPQLPPRVDEQAQLIPDDIGLSRTSYQPDVISAHFVERAATPFIISCPSYPPDITPESSPRASRPSQRAQSPFSDTRHPSYHPVRDAPESPPRAASLDDNEVQTPSDLPRQSHDSDVGPPRRRSPPSLSSYGSTASLTIRSFSTGLPRYKSKDSLPKWSPAPPMRMQDLSGSSPPVARQIRRLPPIPAVQSMVLPSVADAGPSSRLTV